jgi:hypothetical protein
MSTHTVSPWPADQLRTIIDADDLHVAPLREDGSTFGTPTWIWCVERRGGLYVRAYNGPDSRWYRAAVSQKAGRITAAGMTLDVRFEPVRGDIEDDVDAAYRSKYHGNRYLGSMVSPRACATTLRIVPTV